MKKRKPAMLPEDNRSHIVGVRLSKAEREMVLILAKRKGLNVSTWIRMAIVTAMDKEVTG